VVKTASYGQVIQKVYRSSLARYLGASPRSRLMVRPSKWILQLDRHQSEHCSTRARCLPASP